MTRAYDIDRELALELDRNFTYHPPDEDQARRYQNLRAAGLSVAAEICRKCPKSRERSLALTKVEEAIFWANAAIARGESPAAPLSTLVGQ